ncbi:relaxase domain-containing protein [Streptomyces sp. NPDC046859]|uniref:relaxase domain-containing protein n=1 Tax=Streptomyces sp. NPDC046859 TaxID=3155734 RepID=UPI0033F87DCB
MLPRNGRAGWANRQTARPVPGRPQRRAVTGYDLTFSNEALSLLFALGGPEVRRIVLQTLAQARTEALEWIEHHCLAVRTGAHGVAQQRAEPGLPATVYLYHESRASDPMLLDTRSSPRA